MMAFSKTWTATAVGLCLGTIAWAASDTGLDTGASDARQAFLDENPGTGIYMYGDRIGRVYGQAFSAGATPEESAEAFMTRYAPMFGVTMQELEAASNLADARHTTDVYFEEETGGYKFTLVYYRQVAGGIPVYASDVRLLVRNEGGFPLVLVSSALKELGGFQIPAIAHTLDADWAFSMAQLDNPDLQVAEGGARFVIWAGIDDMQVEPALAVEIVANNALVGQVDYQRYRYLIDAVSGEILHKENLILNIDVAGSVKANATTGPGADACYPEAIENMAYARVSISGGSTAFADKNGNFSIPNGGSSPVTVVSEVRGRYFRVNDNGGPLETLSMVVTPPGPANFTHNAPNTSEFVRAQINAYVEANVVRDAILFANPSYPTIAGQLDWPANVNIASTCNAFYDGDSINFYRAGGGCNNTAFSSVVHHEYGHHLVATGGSGQGQYGEGMGDTMGIIILDEPRVGIGFQVCSGGIRSGENTKQYPCNGAIHDCGQLISGCAWETRNELVVTEPANYTNILLKLAVNAVLVHSGSTITPQITIDWLTLDDNDGNIGNGTPHYNEIATGFGEHNMDAPPLALLDFVYPGGRPSSVLPGAPFKFDVVINDLNGTLDVNSPKLNYQLNGGATTTVNLVRKTGRTYEVTFPAITCPTKINWYLTALTTTGASERDPNTGSYETTCDNSVQCSDISSFNASCKGGNVKFKVKLTSDKSGEVITVNVGGLNQNATVNGKKAKGSLCCFNGNVAVNLVKPAGCAGGSKTVTCN